MELKINVEYNQILNMIHQLPVQEIEKLYSALQSQLSLKNKKNKKKLKEIILSAPTWTNAEYAEYIEIRNNINKTRLI